MSQVVERNNSAVLGYNLNDDAVARLRDSDACHSIAATEYIYICNVCVLCTDSRPYMPRSSPKRCALWLFFVMSVGFKLRPLVRVRGLRAHSGLPGLERRRGVQSLGSMHPCTCYNRKKDAPEPPMFMCGRVRPRRFIRSPPHHEA